MCKWDRICTIHICIRVQVRERERKWDRNMATGRNENIGSNIPDSGNKNKNKRKKSFCISSLKSKPSSH